MQIRGRERERERERAEGEEERGQRGRERGRERKRCINAWINIDAHTEEIFLSIKITVYEYK